MNTYSLKTRFYLVLFATAVTAVTFGTQAEAKKHHHKHSHHHHRKHAHHHRHAHHHEHMAIKRHYEEGINDQEMSEALHEKADKEYAIGYLEENGGEREALKGNSHKARKLFEQAERVRRRAHHNRAKAYEKQADALDHIVQAKRMESRELHQKGMNHVAKMHENTSRSLSKLMRKYRSDATKKRALANKGHRY